MYSRNKVKDGLTITGNNKQATSLLYNYPVTRTEQVRPRSCRKLERNKSVHSHVGAQEVKEIPPPTHPLPVNFHIIFRGFFPISKFWAPRQNPFGARQTSSNLQWVRFGAHQIEPNGCWRTPTLGLVGNSNFAYIWRLPNRFWHPILAPKLVILARCSSLAVRHFGATFGCF